MGDDRNQKQPDYFNPDNFFADDSFGTSLGDDYSSFFSDDDLTAGGAQEPFMETPEQNPSDWMAGTEQKQEQMPQDGGAPDFWSLGNGAGQSGQSAGPQPGAGSSPYGGQQSGTGSSPYGGQQPGTGSSPYGGQQPGTGGNPNNGQQPGVPNDGPVILGGIDGGSKKPKKGLPVPAIAAIAVAVALVVGVPYFLHSRTDPGPVAPVDDPDDSYDDDDDTYVSYVDSLSDYGTDYNDFYSRQYAMAEMEHGYAADEICVIDNESYIGNAASPVRPETYYSMFVNENRFTMLAPLQSSYSECGYTITFAGLRSDSEMVPGILCPPETADRDNYFQMVKEGFDNLEDYEKDNYTGVTFGDIRTTAINGNEVAYMEVTYTDEAGTGILDTFSFEERPSGNAFLTEYRCRRDDVSDGLGALHQLYGNLTFYTEGFDSIDAAKHRFITGRIYNESHSHWAEFTAPDYNNYALYDSTIGSPDELSFSYSGKNYAYKSIWLDYQSYSRVDSHESFREYIEDKLESEESSEYITDVELTNEKEFTFSGYDVYFFSYDKTEHYGNNPSDVRVYEYRIHIAQDDELYLWINDKYSVSEDAFDPETFLSDHLTMN